MTDSRECQITAHIRIIGMGTSEEGEPFAKLRIRLPGETRDALISLRELENSKSAFSALDARLISQGAQRELRDRLQQTSTRLAPSFDVITRAGFHRNVFVHPDETTTPSDADAEVCLPSSHRPYRGKFKSRGQLKAWKRVPELARGNPSLMLAIALAFTAPIVELLRLEVPMVQVVGVPGSGKSAIAAVAGSVWGGGSDGLFAESWNNTTAKLELIAEAHHATFLVLDETRTLDAPHPRLIGAPLISAIMRLSEGRVKGRWTDADAPVRYRTPVFSTSNCSLDEMARAAGVLIDDAVRGRMIDMPLVGGVIGAFGNLHGMRDHAEFATELLKIVRENYGVAGDEYVAEILDWLHDDREGLMDWLRGLREYFLRHVREGVRSTTRDLTRIHQKVATIYAGGRLASHLGILPWTQRELLEALIASEKGHVGLVEHEEASNLAATTVSDALAVLRAHVQRNHSRFVDLRDGLVDPSSDHNHQRCDGYVCERRGAIEVLFAEAKLEALCGNRASVLRLKERLRSMGYLLEGENRPAVRRPIWASGDRLREYVIAVKAEAFGDKLFE